MATRPSYPTEPLPLNHSWPLFDAETQMAIPSLVPFSIGDAPSPRAVAAIDGALAARGIGVWECDLSDNSLTWSGGVYDLFGLPRGSPIDRMQMVALYTPQSRIAMEQLRAYAIRHKRGFTVDVEICQPGGEHRWMRLSAVPVLVGGKVARLCGLKVDVTAEYAEPLPTEATLDDRMPLID